MQYFLQFIENEYYSTGELYTNSHNSSHICTAWNTIITFSIPTSQFYGNRLNT